MKQEAPSLQGLGRKSLVAAVAGVEQIAHSMLWNIEISHYNIQEELFLLVFIYAIGVLDPALFQLLGNKAHLDLSDLVILA